MGNYSPVTFDWNTVQCYRGMYQGQAIARSFGYWTKGTQVDLLTLTYANAIPSSLDTSKISIKYNNVTYSAGSDFDVVVDGNVMYLMMKQPIVRFALEDTQTQIWVTVPGMQNEACPTMGAYIKNKTAQNPSVCTGQNLTDINGGTVPAMTNYSVSGKQPARTLTDWEKAQGNRTYVVSSLNADGTPSGGQNRSQTQLYYQGSASDAFIPIGSPTGWIVNAIAYNQQDNWIYGVSQGRIGVWKGSDGNTITDEDPCFPAGHLLQIDPVTGDVYDLGQITAANGTGYGIAGQRNGAWPNDLWGGISTGFFDANGQLWVANASMSGSGALYKVDINNVTATAKRSTSARCQQTSSATWCARSEDHAILPNSAYSSASANKYAWGIQHSWVSGTSKVYIERIDLTTGATKTWDITSLTTIAGVSIPTGYQWGKAWTYGNGNLGFGTGSSGANSTSIQIKVTNPAATTPTFELVGVQSNAPKSYNTDGTSTGLVEGLNPDLSIEKTAERYENGRMYWKVAVTNNSDVGSSGFLVNDQFDSSFSDVQVGSATDVTDSTFDVAMTATNGTVCTTSVLGICWKSVNVTQLQFGRLPAHHTVEVEFSAAMKATSDQCVTNVMTLIPNDADDVTANNTSEASLCSLGLEKKAVDVNGSGGIDTGDSAGTMTVNGTTYQTVRYDLIAKNPGNTALPYVLTDTPQFTEDVKPAYVIIKKKDAAGAGANVTWMSSTIALGDAYDPGSAAFDPTGNPVSITGTYNAQKGTTSSDQVTLAAGTNDYWEVVYLYTMRPEAKVSDTNQWGHLQCIGSKGSGTAQEGLFNTASLNDVNNSKVHTDEDCVPIEPPSTPEDVSLQLQKVSADDVVTALAGADFRVYAVDAKGNQTDSSALTVEADGSYKLGAGYYGIDEVKAPEGYSLLPSSLFIQIKDNGNGSASVAVMEKSGGTLVIATAASQPFVSVDSATVTWGGTATLRIADVMKGDLPNMGGAGVGPALAVGALLLACAGAAALSGRRRK